MYLKEIWRYPVKSMAGEQLQSAEVTSDGIEGDRLVQARGSRGEVVTARIRPKLLSHKAKLNETGEPLVDGRLWSAPDVAKDVELATGPGVKLVRDEGPDRFDILPLLVGTDGAYAVLGYDHRRFRPNLVIGGVNGLAERTWEGKRLKIGEVLIQMVDLRGRCVMTTYDPDTIVQDRDVLRRIAMEYDGVFCLNCLVLVPGTVKVGDPVELVDQT
jgi:uncharacterized protein YcbX